MSVDLSRHTTAPPVTAALHLFTLGAPDGGDATNGTYNVLNILAGR